MATVDTERTIPWPSTTLNSVFYSCCCSTCAHADTSEAVKSGSWMRFFCLEILLMLLAFCITPFLCILFIFTWFTPFWGFIFLWYLCRLHYNSLLYIRFLNRKAIAQRMGFVEGKLSQTFFRYYFCASHNCCFLCFVDAQEVIAVKSSLQYNINNFCYRFISCTWLAMRSIITCEASSLWGYVKSCPRVAVTGLYNSIISCPSVVASIFARFLSVIAWLFDRMLCINMDIPVAVIDWSAYPRPALPEPVPVVLSSQLQRPTFSTQSVSKVGSGKPVVV